MAHQDSAYNVLLAQEEKLIASKNAPQATSSVTLEGVESERFSFVAAKRRGGQAIQVLI